jgi:outer membrane cobalamin receptor
MSFEMGIKQALSKTMDLDLALFSSDYKELIEPQLDLDPDQAVVVKFKNVVKARVQGLDFSHRTDWWSNLVTTRIGYMFSFTRDLSPGIPKNTPLKYRSKHTLYATADLKYRPFTIGVDFRYLSQIQRIDVFHKAYIPDIESLVPTYVVSIRLGAHWKHYSARLIVDNLLQYNYLTSPAAMGAPRSAVLQLSFNY